MQTKTYTVSLRARFAVSGRTLKPAAAAATRQLLVSKGAVPEIVENVLTALKPGQSLTVTTEHGFADIRAN